MPHLLDSLIAHLPSPDIEHIRCGWLVRGGSGRHQATPESRRCQYRRTPNCRNIESVE